MSINLPGQPSQAVVVINESRYHVKRFTITVSFGRCPKKTSNAVPDPHCVTSDLMKIKLLSRSVKINPALQKAHRSAASSDPVRGFGVLSPVNLRTVTAPCGVLLTAQIGGLDRAVAPRGHGVAGRCALQNRAKTYNFLVVAEDQPANER